MISRDIFILNFVLINYVFNRHRVRVRLSCLREAAPLLELDRDERKLEAFLQLHKHDLLVADLRIFLPFTINLDPYFRKVLKEDQQAMEDEGIIIPTRVQPPPPSRSHSTTIAPNPSAFFGAGFNTNPFNAPTSSLQPNQQMMLQQPQPAVPLQNPYPMNEPTFTQNPQKKRSLGETNFFDKSQNADFIHSFPVDLQQVRLSKLSSDGLYAILQQIDDLQPTVEKLGAALSLNAINGRVLMHCDLAELKSVSCLLGIDCVYKERFEQYK